MPRPTSAQLVYGSVTVVLSTLAMLLLSGATSGIGMVVIVVSGLALGVLVAVSLAMPWTARGPQSPDAAAPRRRGGPEPRLSEHPLRR